MSAKTYRLDATGIRGYRGRLPVLKVVAVSGTAAVSLPEVTGYRSRNDRVTITGPTVPRKHMSTHIPDEDMSSRTHRTLEFAAMRDNIAECVAVVDAQTFGQSAT
ncbi:hypothetical protein GRX01_06110 [Halobaculum sp. WSA2]|uniref:Uncharacterized protein n=1 Tax=Halobaculum saliterrae TaxID=2073113 RepID=A0A6B0SWA8_9EURY|nr:hypothetical protein [Halobaculum saliterrae]MXR40913.1 hypothetical protein [Halobaculum saliterrae]